MGVKTVDSAIKEKIEELSLGLRKEVLDYIEFLSKKYSKKVLKGELRFDWEGGLSDLKEEYTSVELQHKSVDWR